jgi:elongation factor Ts
MTISADQVKQLRDQTGAGVMQCKKALEETGGDLEKSVEILRKRGEAAAEKKVGRTAGEGVIESYIHPGSKVGVLVEINCETDFVARTEDYRQFVHDICLHIAAAAPIAVGREDVDPGVVASERAIYEDQARTSGKPEQIWPKIVEGRLEKFYEEFVLLEQPFVKDPDRKVRDMLTGVIAKLGENVIIRRFTRFQLGEGLKK